MLTNFNTLKNNMHSSIKFSDLTQGLKYNLINKTPKIHTQNLTNRRKNKNPETKSNNAENPYPNDN